MVLFGGNVKMAHRAGAGLTAALTIWTIAAIPMLAIAADSPDGITLAQSPNAAKKRIAVLDFDSGAVSGNPFAAGFLNQGASKGVSDLLVNKLVESGNYRVIERSRIDQILQEQNLGDSGRVDPDTAARIGKLLGVEVVVVGSITQFNVERRTSGGGLFGIGSNTTTGNAVVQLSARLIDTETGEILATANGKGDADQSNTSVSVFGIGGGSSNSNEDTLLRLAADKAVNQVVTAIAGASSKLTGSVSIEATIADITGGQVTLNKGSSAGFTTGMTLAVNRVTKQVKDPSTGKVIRTISSAIGQIQLIEVTRDYAVGRIVAGSGFKVGDKVKAD
jgi:curli biogenesis system outer membrane secretion channel CsgG